MVDTNAGFGPFFLEIRRDRRLEVWSRLRQWFYDGNFAEGRYPYMSIEPWFEDPDPPWPRVPCTLPMTEIFYNSELHYSSVIRMITARTPFIYQKATSSDPPERSMQYPELDKASQKWNHMHPELKEELKTAEIPSLDGVKTDGIKFLVFRTAPTPDHVLERFLGSREQLDPRDESFKAFEPFSYLIADTGGFALGGHETATGKEDLGHFPPSRFIEKSAEEVVEAFEKIVAPLKDRRSLYSTRCFIILDAASQDGDTAKVVVAMHDKWCERLVTFGALKKGILKAFEMLFLDPDMLKLDDRKLITEDSYGPEVG